MFKNIHEISGVFHCGPAEVEKLPMECRSDESLRFLEGISREAPGGIQVDLFIDSTFLGVFDVYRLACS